MNAKQRDGMLWVVVIVMVMVVAFGTILALAPLPSQADRRTPNIERIYL